MALADLLQSLFSPQASQGSTAFGQTANAIAPGQSTTPGIQGSTPLSALVINAANAPASNVSPAPLAGRPSVQSRAPVDNSSLAPLASILQPSMPSSGATQDPQAPAFDYNNSQDVSAVNGAVNADEPYGGSTAGRGVYGALPSSLQHGTLRGILGALGDAFLVGSNRQPEYQPRIERQEIGNAMAGINFDDPNSVQSGIARIAATGAPNAAEMANQVRQSYEEAQLRKATQENTMLFHQSTIDARHESLYNRMAPMAQADLSQATSAADYAARKALWDKRITSIDPNQDSTSALGIPPTYAAPGGLTSTSGMTNTQITAHQDRQTGQAVSTTNAHIRAGGSVAAAGVSANRPSPTTMLQGLIDKQKNGGTLTPDEQNYVIRNTQPAHTSRGLAPGLTPNAPHTAPPRFVPGQVYQDAKGNNATYNANGTWTPHT